MHEHVMSPLMVLESVFPSRGGGGAEMQVQTLCVELQRRGVPVSVVVPMVNFGPQAATDTVHGIPVTRLRYPKIPGLGAIWMLLAFAWMLVRERHRYDVIHTHIAGNMSAVCCIVGKLLGKPVVVKLTGLTEMRGGILDPAPRWSARLRKAALQHASFYQATSSRIARMLADRGFAAARVRRIPNAVDMARFACRDAVGANDEKRLVAVYVGRLEAEKGVDVLLQGWAEAFAHRDDTRLMMVGSGRLELEMRALAAKLGIAEQVQFVGPSSDVQRYLATAHFGVLASLHEGLSNTLLEYMAAGLPVLGSRVSGTEDFVIAGQTGWLFAPGDADSLARILQRASDAGIDELQRLGRNARQLVNEQASIGSVVDQLMQVYRCAA
jgi:glycosyltransferase involved in cell wall biosynthesis